MLRRSVGRAVLSGFGQLFDGSFLGPAETFSSCRQSSRDGLLLPILPPESSKTEKLMTLQGAFDQERGEGETDLKTIRPGETEG